MIEGCNKYDRYGQIQQRIFILSDKAVYLVSAKKVHSKFHMKDVQYIIKSLASTEFIFHMSNEREKIYVRLDMNGRD